MFNPKFFNNDSQSASSNTSDEVRTETKTTNQSSGFNWTALVPITIFTD